MVEEHASLRILLDRMRRTADKLDQSVEDPLATLRDINTELTALLLPHQMAEEQAVFPELADRLGGRDPLGSMNRMHEEIVHLATRFGTLVQGLPETRASDARDTGGAAPALLAGCDHHASFGRGGGTSVTGRGSAHARLSAVRGGRHVPLLVAVVILIVSALPLSCLIPWCAVRWGSICSALLSIGGAIALGEYAAAGVIGLMLSGGWALEDAQPPSAR